MTDSVADIGSAAGQGQHHGERPGHAALRAWLYLVCLLILAMVLVGGATRLTDSGLSITEWKPIHGTIPPLSVQEWQEEFEKYRQIPEYQQINKGMSLEEFKFIYWWEWGHRQLGRIIGLVFFLPLVWFWARGQLHGRLKPQLVLLLALGGMQGFIGWWMVTSGLVERTDVSQYRLAVHLTLACGIFAYAFWIARGLVPDRSPPSNAPLRIFAACVTLFVLVQIFLGGLVAGLDAGLAFNDWPTMDGAVIPDGLLLLEPAWRNFFENPKTVQFTHRMSGYLLLAVITIQWLVVTRLAPEGSRSRYAALQVPVAFAQAGLGIATLLLQVPISLALAHQGVAVVLLGLAVAHWRQLSGSRSQTVIA